MAWVLVAVGCGDNVVPATRIVGQVFADDNGNGVRDEGEAPLAAVVYVNLDHDPSIGINDPRTRTAADGTYTLTVDGAGTYDLRVIPPFGQRAGQDSRARRVGAPAIIGGDDAGAGDYGFMISLAYRFGNNVYPSCGGALITDRHVITAAHCSGDVTPHEAAVIAGSLDPYDDAALILDVENIRVHPSYDFNAEHGFDVAIWTLAEPIDLDATRLSTVEMVTDATGANAKPGVLATTIGWGVSDRESSLLQEVHLPVASAADCAAFYPEALHFDTQICAGALEGGIDSCQGDSGGPLLVRDVARQVWLHAGITSYGDGCGLPGIPGVYARTSALAGWVMEHALEPPASVQVTVERASEAVVDLPTHSTLRPQAGPIAPRWQATGSTIPSTVSPDAPLAVRWSILADDPSLIDFNCHFKQDIFATGPGLDVACGVGVTELALPGYPTGVYATELTVTRDGAMFRRRADITAGTPAAVTEFGLLEPTDRLDPDYAFASYYIDYYEVSGLTGTRAFVIEATSHDFDIFLVLYDLDERSFVSGGGAIAFGDLQMGGGARLVVLPEPGRRYLIGVSSVASDALGGYELSLINDGVLIPR